MLLKYIQHQKVGKFGEKTEQAPHLRIWGHLAFLVLAFDTGGQTLFWDRERQRDSEWCCDFIEAEQCTCWGMYPSSRPQLHCQHFNGWHAQCWVTCGPTGVERDVKFPQSSSDRVLLWYQLYCGWNVTCPAGQGGSVTFRCQTSSS